MCGNIYCLEVTASGEGKLCKIVKKIRQSGRYGINRREALPKSKQVCQVLATATEDRSATQMFKAIQMSDIAYRQWKFCLNR